MNEKNLATTARFWFENPMRIRDSRGPRDALVRQCRERKIYQIDPETEAILRTIESGRFVIGVTSVDGQLEPPAHQKITLKLTANLPPALALAHSLMRKVCPCIWYVHE